MPNALTKEGLEERLAEVRETAKQREEDLKARIARMVKREKSVKELERWLKAHGLERHDLLLMYQAMAPQREAKPVKSKKPLHPSVKAVRRDVGGVGGYEKKGDPEFCRRVRAARIEKGITTADMAEKLGVSGAAVSSWEVGRYVPREEMRQKVVKLLGLPADLGEKISLKNEARYFGKKGNGEAASPP
jgi:ribosome-binding protein aMBF1 (putative translation factor)